MIFDFDRFTVSVMLAYRRCGGSSYTLPEVLRVFRYYFETYELISDSPHPAISIQQIANIIDKMPIVNGVEEEDEDGNVQLLDVELTPEDYELLIDQHFNTKYKRGCDYNINHIRNGSFSPELEKIYYSSCNYYRGVGTSAFKRANTSSVERELLRKERKERRFREAVQKISRDKKISLLIQYFGYSYDLAEWMVDNDSGRDYSKLLLMEQIESA